MSKYYLNYEFGIHHVTIEVAEGEFHKVIDDLSNEFTIFKLTYLDPDENSEYDDDEKSYKVTKTEYLIENYVYDMVIIGYKER